MPENSRIIGHGTKKEVIPKNEDLDFGLPSETIFPRQTMDHGVNSWGSNMRSLFIGMGFSPSLVDKVLGENGEDLGEDSMYMLLEVLIGYSGPQRSKSGSSDSFDRMLDEHDVTGPEVSKVPLKEEDNWSDGACNQKRASLRLMNFSTNEIEFAMSKLGENAEIIDLVEFIVAAQISSRVRDTNGRRYSFSGMNKDASDGALFRTMEKTLRLVEMGFNESEILTVFGRFGANASIAELADSIFTSRCGEVDKEYVQPSTSSIKVESEDHTGSTASQSSLIRTEEILKGKRPKEEYSCGYTDLITTPCHLDFRARRQGKKLKQELLHGSSSFNRLSSWAAAEEEAEEDTRGTGLGRQFILQPVQCMRIHQVVAKPPFFFYGSVVNIPREWWAKISQFLYSREPEFVSTQFFSALSRKEGYVHNLPTENRFHIQPIPPMIIQEVIPHTKKWWPSWDTRQQLGSISSKISGLSQLCESFGKVLTDTGGLPSLDQQKDILSQCQALSLLWVGPHKLCPLEAEHLEAILGYPMNHTQVSGSSTSQRLERLRHCFQTDTLGYHLSVLKSKFPDGLTVLSLFTGVGSAEVALHRLGVRLKAVVSVEKCESNKKIIRRWWQSTEQTGELVEMESIQRLTTNRLDSLIKKFGGFDLVICQNPCILSPKSKVASEGGDFPGFDFTLFYEFVRVLQRVRSIMERKR
ncbi:hypothetical protein SAY87_022358 [Trapa incisa]|uniref:SAM-dependent MTase DRM-type domain-containing protein n=1 Tax=Trapa incisa TaxID=236973 RepID=A0AAN7Q436_9MYRT|nr:hypothetical protein SAY87_022358 [Trapa incisa]